MKMDILPEIDESDISSNFEVKKTTKPKREKKLRRKRVEKDALTMLDAPMAHVVVTTTPLKPKTAKPESKLRRKLHEFETEKETLAKTITEKNIEINALKKSVDSLNEVLNSVPIDELRNNSSIASSKILELSKKNRQLRSDLEQFKNRCTKKDVQIDKLERELKANEEKFQQNVELIKKGTTADDLQSKVNNMQQKLFEARNKNTELQNQLKLAQKCLQQEVGENVNINTLHTTQSGNWRGRAQQILTLQQKLQDMRARVEAYEEQIAERAEYITPVAMGSDFDVVSGNSQTQLQQSEMPPVHIFERYAPSVRKTELQHRAKVEALEKEITTLQQQLEEQRSKVLALKVRNKTLNDDMQRYKLKTNALEVQTDYNGINMHSMNERLTKQRLQYENRLDDARCDLLRVTEERDTALRQLEELSMKNLELEAAVRERGAFNVQLQDMVKRLETDVRALSGGFLFACREFRKDEFVSLLDALEVEKNQLLLYNKELNKRLDAEREKQEAAVEQATKQKQRIARLDAKIRDLEKELETQTERKKRSQRMAEYANSLSRTSLTSSSLSSFTFENQSQYAASLQSLNQNDNTKMEELKNNLDLANEKIIMLNEKIAFLSKEKQIDSKFFEDTLVNSKNVILETILAQRNEQKNAHATANRSISTTQIPVRTEATSEN